MINFFQQIKKTGKAKITFIYWGLNKKVRLSLLFFDAFFFNKRKFLSLIAAKEVFTFVPYSNSRLKNQPMNDLKTYFLRFPKPSGLLKTFLSGLGIFLCFQLYAQGWEIYFGGNGEDFGHSIIQTRDRGYIAAGFSESFGSDNDMDVYVIRTDVDGTETWSNSYDDGFIEHGYSIIETPDKSFLVVGDIRQTQLSNSNVYLLKIDERGKKIWSKQFGGTGNDAGYRIIQTINNGGYLIIGTTNSSGSGDEDVYLLKIDAQGNQVWAKTYGAAGNDYGRGVLELSDGYLVTGTAYNAANESADLYLLKVDFNGNQLWQKFYGSPNDIDEGYDLVMSNDGNIVLAGYTGSLSDVWLLKVTPDGTGIWTKTFGGELGDQAFDILKAGNGDLIVTGVTEIDPTNSDAFLARFDADGNEIWFNNVGRGSYVDWAQAVAPADDGGFIVTGYNSLFGAFINDVTFIKAGADGSVYTNHLKGKIYRDGGDCTFQQGEMGLNDWIVKAVSPAKTFFGTTDTNGNYSITLDSGDYVVSVLLKNGYWDDCIAAYNVTFNGQYDTLVRNFPMLAVVNCPLLQVDVSAPVAQNCSNIAYSVSYCNTGTATVNAATVNIILDKGLDLTGSSIPVALQVDSLYVFDVGSIGLDECGSFYIYTTSDCSGLPATAYRVSAHITPDSTCLPVSPHWDMSDIKLNGYCDVDSVHFFIKNEGTGDMQQVQKLIVIEDNVMLFTQPESFQLIAGESKKVAYPAKGATYRLIAEQSPNHPGNSYPTVAVEGCTTTGTYSTGFVSQFHEDENDPFVSIDIQESISPTDYIFLRGYPKGYLQDGKNLISANTDVEYHIYFQNAGTDTITRLVIRDTLPPGLDLSTVVAGASSHPYDFEVYNDGILKFTFDDILLPPDGGAASQGFIQFKVAQKPDNPAGTIIPNSATVFFGYDAPFQTNTYTHVVGGAELLDFIVITDVNEPEIPGLKVNAYPNPFATTIQFEVAGMQIMTLTIDVFDIKGQHVRRENASGNNIRIYRQELPSGTYPYRLEADGRLIHTGKIIVR
jgi:uncharacterized repeat protein (TIGR01451 family)